MSQKTNVQTGYSNSGKSNNSGTVKHGNTDGKHSSLNHSAVHKPVPGNGGKNK